MLRVYEYCIEFGSQKLLSILFNVCFSSCNLDPGLRAGSIMVRPIHSMAVHFTPPSTYHITALSNNVGGRAGCFELGFG